jgi:hypothetical protein
MGAVGPPFLVHERPLHDLVGAGRRRVPENPNVPGPPLRADVRLGVQPAREGDRIELGPIPQHQARHHLVAGLVIRNAVRTAQDDVGVSGEGSFDRRSQEVLTVDPDPVGVAAGEVQVTVFVHVPEVAGPVPPEPGRARVGLRVVVVALERPDAGGIDDLADALGRVEHAAGRLLDAGDRKFVAVLVDDLDVGPGLSERAGSFGDVTIHRDAAFGRAIRVDDLDVEPAGEGVDDLR